MSTFSVPLNQFNIAQTVLKQPTSHPPANLPVPNPTKAFWIDYPDANPLASEGSEGSLTAEADICIIGSGITGVGAAYHLSQAIADGKLGGDKPLKAVILEARDFCSGATGRNGGHLTFVTYKYFREFQDAYGTEQAIRSLILEKRTVKAILDLIDLHNLTDAVDLVEWGHNDLFLTEKELSDAELDLKHVQDAQVDISNIKKLSNEQVKQTYGAQYPAFRTPGHNIWPLKLVTELYKIARSRTPKFSLNLHTRTPVTSISSSSPDISSTNSYRHIVHTPRGSISCSYIIHATNAYASHLLPHFTGPYGIIPNRAQIIALRAGVSRDELGMAGWSANEGFEYWFPMSAKYDGGKDMDEKTPLVILGGGREATAPNFEFYEDDDSVLNENVSRALKDFLPSVFKERYKKGREPELEWSGIIGRTKIKDPFVGPVLDADGGAEKYKGHFISAGYSGHGMPRAFGCAEVVADMIVSEITGRKWSVPEWLPERFFTWNRV